MSLSRNLFHEFRPFFRLFDEVSRSRVHPSQILGGRHWDDFGFADARRPSVDLSEQGNDYVVEAEVPGVKKDNLEVRISDQGRSLTIEGRTFARSSPATNGESTPATAKNGDSPAAQDTNTKVAPAHADATTQISSEREFVGSSHFTRTVWLPRAVDGSKVTASLADGILTLRVPKAVDQGSLKVNIQ